MKRNFILLLAVFSGMMGFGQAKKKPANPSPVNLLKSQADSLSYAVGISVANFYKEQGIDGINTQIVAKAINDALKNSTLLINEQQCNNIIISYIQKLKADKAAVNRKAGEVFLADNKTKPGVVTLPSGLQYTILKDATGPKPTVSDKVKCNYEGKLIDGTIFDSSVKQGKPIEFTVGGVIPGWTEALQLMPVGSKWRLFIPSNLAYGDQQPSPVIKPGSTLIFDVELLEIVK